MATRQVASELAKAETEKTGTGPIAGGPAATAQSQMTKEKNLADKVADVQGKAADEISQKDARELQSKEVRSENPPPPPLIGFAMLVDWTKY